MFCFSSTSTLKHAATQVIAKTIKTQLCKISICWQNWLHKWYRWYYMFPYLNLTPAGLLYYQHLSGQSQGLTPGHWIADPVCSALSNVAPKCRYRSRQKQKQTSKKQNQACQTIHLETRPHVHHYRMTSLSVPSVWPLSFHRLVNEKEVKQWRDQAEKFRRGSTLLLINC